MMMERQQEIELERFGAFEVGKRMLTLAHHHHHNNRILNAGRGNPNWINTKARLAMARLIEFGVSESNRTICSGDMGGYVEEEKIGERFRQFVDPQRSVDQFLLKSLNFVHDHFGMSEDDFLAEMVNGVIGNNYPNPSRVLKNTEILLNQYLQNTLYHEHDLAGQTELFPTEGGSAAIDYIFHSLVENELIKSGDKIAINTPIFTPYLEIPRLNDYQLVEMNLRSERENNWQIDPKELAKLNDPTIKALFIVNPTNPASHAFSPAALHAIAEAVKRNPKLMIITDDVYGPFVKDFQSIYGIAPHNTLLVYSFSKLYGATGCRLGLIAVNKHNVFDQLIRESPADKKKRLQERYSIVTMDPDNFHFIDRMVADSRSVGLYHTAGLSTPQQIQEVLFALTDLLGNGVHDDYIQRARRLVSQRSRDLHIGLGMTSDDHDLTGDAKYYSLINLYSLAEKRFGHPFRQYLEHHFERIDFLVQLAEENGVVLMDGVGFGSRPGEIRISNANLPTEDYRLIGRQVGKLLVRYYQRFKKQKEESRSGSD